MHHEGEGRGWQSALFVSALCGLWRLPIATGMPFPLLIMVLLTVHCFIGIPLSFAWRRSRNLTGAAFAHTPSTPSATMLLGL